MLRLSAGERLKRLDSPLRAFRPIDGTKNSHDGLPFSVTAKTTRVIPGIRSALDVPVACGKRKGESALFQGVASKTGALEPVYGAAFCSREENTTVVIRVSRADWDAGAIWMTVCSWAGLSWHSQEDVATHSAKPLKGEGG
jgi:hypothetical protein